MWLELQIIILLRTCLCFTFKEVELSLGEDYHKHHCRVRMFVFFWVMLMLLMGGMYVNANTFVRICNVLLWHVYIFPLFTDSSTSAQRYCANRQCLNMEEEVSAEAGLCAVIPCSFSDFPFAGPQRILWFKCESTEECDKPVMIFHSNSQFQDGFNARISLLEYHPYSRNCSIIMNDLTELDSGSYVSRFAGKPNPYSPSIRTTVSVKGTKSYSKIYTAEVVIPKKPNTKNPQAIHLHKTTT